MMQHKPKRILVVYDNRTEDMRLTIKHHLRALETSEIPHEIVYYNSGEAAPGWEVDGPVAPPPQELIDSRFDAVILHYAFLALRTTGDAFFRFKHGFSWIKDLDCLKIAIPQDEADRAGLLDEWLFDWAVDVVFSVHYQADGPLYPRTRTQARIYNCLPGYIDDASANRYKDQIPPLHARPYDIIYRARKLPFWYGSHAQLKHELACVIHARAQSHGLKCDISTRAEDAIVGDKWLDFLATGRAAIGGEGGLTSLDWRGELRAQVEALLARNPDLTFEEVNSYMPAGWDSYHFLTITPRHFEAILMKTCQVLIEGNYRGVLEAGRHYIPLKMDFSNLDSVLEMLRDEQLVKNMVEEAYQDICLSGKYSYRKFAALIEQVLYNPALNQRPGGKVKQTDEKNPDIAALERQLVAERHIQALLQAKLQLSEQQRINSEQQCMQITQKYNELRNLRNIPLARWAIWLLKLPLRRIGFVVGTSTIFLVALILLVVNWLLR